MEKSIKSIRLFLTVLSTQHCTRDGLSSTDENLWGKQKQCPLVEPSCMDGTGAYYITPCFPLAIVLESGNHFISLSCNFLTCEGNRLV